MLSAIFNRETYEVNKLYETIKVHTSCVCRLFLTHTFRSTDHHDGDLAYTRQQAHNVTASADLSQVALFIV
jgi:hypothetical protein